MKSYVKRNYIVRDCTVDTPFITTMIHIQSAISGHCHLKDFCRTERNG